MMKWKSRKLWVTIVSIGIAVAAPLWVTDSTIYIALVSFLATNCGLYGYNANAAARNHIMQEQGVKDD